jgi:hypothetical protein
MKHLLSLTCLLQLVFTGLRAQSPIPADENMIRRGMTSQSLSFIENKGQFADEKGNPLSSLFYLASGNGFMTSIHDKGITYAFIKSEPDSRKEKELEKESENKSEVAWVYLELSGANIEKSNIVAEEKAEEYYNYYLSNCPGGITFVSAFKKITIKSVYPGIDWVIYSTGTNGLKYDFIVHPGADPNQIKMIYHGATSVTKNSSAEKLLIKTSLGQIEEGTLKCYEEGSGYKIASQYELKKNEVSFHIDDYNRGETLIIDPAMEWGTYFGGTGPDGPMDIDADGSGNWFVTGYTGSSESGVNAFPLLNPGGGACYYGMIKGTCDCFIAKFDNWGVRKWVTYYGGTSNVDRGLAITANSSFVYVTGYTGSSDFPVTNSSTYSLNNDAFYLKFNLAGVTQFATYLGGSGTENGNELYVDVIGNVFIVGFTTSTNFPTSIPYQPANGGGIDLFITKYSSTNTMGWSTYYGGTGNDYARAITGNSSTNLFITGTTSNSTFPVSFGSFGGGISDAFILRFTTTGLRTWATFFGGSGSDTGNGIEIDPASATYFYVAGTTTSTGSPFNINSVQSTNAGNTDLFAAKLDVATGSTIVWSTFYGGSGADSYGAYDPPNTLCMGKRGVYMVGATTSNNFPTVSLGASCAYNQPNPDLMTTDQDGFIVCFSKTASVCSVFWSTYYGTTGANGDWLNSCTSYGDQIAVCGEFTGASFNSVVPNPNYRTQNLGLGAYSHAYISPGDDGIIAKFTYCVKANAGPDQVVCCFPSTVTIGPNPTPCLTYSWLDSHGNSYSGSPLVVNVTSATTFTLTVTSADAQLDCASSSTDSVTITTNLICCPMPRLASVATTYNVFPNPGSGNFTVSCDGMLVGNTTLTIYDITGRIISKKEYEEFGNQQIVNLEREPAGMYYFEIMINGKTIVRKVVKE